MSFRLLFLLLFVSFSKACHPQFEKELRYLDLYLGIRPADDGKLPQKDASEFASYATSASSLNCNFETDCLWKNAATDHLLDTSDWWLFHKTDTKRFPVQIQPGDPHVSIGSRMLLAGNTTTASESATLLSAPMACQRGPGLLTFHYWLYNSAKIEVIVVKAINRRQHIQTLFRPSMNCHFLRPGGEICKVEIPQVNEPYRLAIRAFNLKDTVVGSMAMINNITYTADLCGDSPFPSLFKSVSLAPSSSKEVETLADLDCSRPLRKCRWSNAASAPSEWRVARSNERWDHIFRNTNNELPPNTSFIFLAVDALSPRPYASLRSAMIPCTQTVSTLSFRYWLKAGTQAEVCSIDEDGVPLSCVYLTEEESSKSVQIDVDAYNKPFRFTIEMIAFDETSLGLIALSDINVTGLLCTEQPPPVVTTVDPPTVASLFGLRQGAGALAPYDLDLNCDFSKDYCSQWVNDDGLVAYGVAPRKSSKMPMPEGIQGNVAMFLMPANVSSSMRSRFVPCAFGAHLHVTYLRTEHASFKICALGNCAEGKNSSGTISLPISSNEPFEIKFHAESTSPSVVVIKRILAVGNVCPLWTMEQLVCHQLQCSFKGGLCSYESVIDRESDKKLERGPNGLRVTLDAQHTRAVLRSPPFDLPAPSLLVLSLTQTAFGSRVLICPDLSSGSQLCHEVLGPKVEERGARRVTFALDAGARQFSIVLSHEHAAQFGAAAFEVHAVDIRTSSDEQFCS